jgi:F0F1-type ATP synthase epsilon subunit
MAVKQAQKAPKKVAKKQQKKVAKKSVPQSTQKRSFRVTKSLKSDAVVTKKEVKPYLEFSLLSPNFSPHVQAEAYAVYVSTTKGDRGILRNAAPAIGTLRPGLVRVYKDANDKTPTKYFVPAGVLRVANDDHSLVITASEIIPFADLDGEAARAVLATATEQANATTDPQQKAKHNIAIQVAQAVVQCTQSKV